MKHLFICTLIFFIHFSFAQNISLETQRQCDINKPYLTKYNITIHTKGSFEYWRVGQLLFDNKYIDSGEQGTLDLKTPGYHDVLITCINHNNDTIRTIKTFYIDTFIKKYLSPPILLSPALQCFENNLVRFRDTTHANTWGIKDYIILIDDGQIFTYKNPIFPLDISFNFKDQRGGSVDIYIESDFCISDTIRNLTSIFSKLKPTFTVSKSKSDSSYVFNVSIQKYSQKGDRILWNFMDGSTINVPRDSKWPESQMNFTRKMIGNLTNPFPMLKITDTFGCKDSIRVYVPTNYYLISDTNTMCSIEGFFGDSISDCNTIRNFTRDFVLIAKTRKGTILGFDNIDYAYKYKIFTDYMTDSVILNLYRTIDLLHPLFSKILKFDSARQSLKKINFQSFNYWRKNDFSITLDRVRPGINSQIKVSFVNKNSKILKNCKFLLDIGNGFSIDTTIYPCHSAGKNQYVFSQGDIAPCEWWEKLINLTNKYTLLYQTNMLYPISGSLIHDSIKLDTSAKLVFSYKTKGNKIIVTLKNQGNKDMENKGNLFVNSSFINSVLLKQGDSILFTSTFTKDQINTYTATYGSLNTTYKNSVLIVKYIQDSTYSSESFQEKIPNYNVAYCVTRHMVRYSYDPNEKLVIYTGDLNNTKGPFPLHYTIHFQNTGTDTAYDVIVRDPLFGAFDISTFKITNSSHPCQFNYINGIAEFNFKNIYLVDSATNAIGSQGFVEFDINGLTDGIENYADIYFDLNKPVRTNTATFKLPTNLYNNTRFCSNFTKADAGPDIVSCNPFLSAKFQSTNNSYYTVKKAKYNIVADTILYTLHLIGCSDTLEDDVFVIKNKLQYQLPALSLKGTDSITCNLSANKYYWYIDGCKLPMETKTIKASWQGTYSIRLKIDSCFFDNLDQYYWINKTTSKTKHLDKLHLTIYPNPTKGILNIEGINSHLNYNIYDMSGKLYLKGQANSLSTFIQTESLKPGIYLLHLEINTGNQSSMIFVKE